MLKPRQNLAFSAEAPQDEVGVEAGPHHFDSDLGLVLLVVTRGQINRTHTTAAQFSYEAVWADATSGHLGLDVHAQLDDGSLHFRTDKRAGRNAIAIQQGLHFVT